LAIIAQKILEIKLSSWETSEFMSALAGLSESVGFGNMFLPAKTKESHFTQNTNQQKHISSNEKYAEPLKTDTESSDMWKTFWNLKIKKIVMVMIPQRFLQYDLKVSLKNRLERP
jgi:hypothetical protein